MEEENNEIEFFSREEGRLDPWSESPRTERTFLSFD